MPNTSSRAMSQPELSIIVPAYRCLSIDQDLREIHQVLTTFALPFELVCVVDGRYSSTDTTEELARSVKLPHLTTLSYPINRGKGYAVRYGFQHAEGKVIGFIDAGHDIDPHNLITAYQQLINEEAEIVIGNKKNHLSSVKLPITRRLYSRTLRILIHLFFNLHLTDTQVGLKLFRRKVIRKLLPLLTINRWAFDLELLAVARLKGYDRIAETPVKLTYNASSNITSHAILHFLYEFGVIFWRMKIVRRYRHS